MSAKHLRATAVIILFFAGIGIGIKECQKNTLIPNPDSDPAPITAIKILIFAGVGIGIEQCHKNTLIPNPDSDPVPEL